MSESHQSNFQANVQANVQAQPQTSVSFENILSWFGTFTPQLKFRLMSLRRETSTDRFEALMRESMTVFRMVLHDLSKYEKGPDRARRTQALLDAEYAANPVKNVSCSSGCSACCRTFAKQISEDDADLLAEAVNSGRVSIDVEALKLQAEQKNSGGACVFLSEDGRCRVYSMRPVVCRKYHVSSPQSACGEDGAKVQPKIDVMPELIASASLSLPDNRFGAMAELIYARIAKKP